MTVATSILHDLTWVALAANVASAVYVAAAIFSVRAFRTRRSNAASFEPPVTVLKPVCGLDHSLYENLRSFCCQDYPCYQVVFGVLDPTDAAIPVVRRLIEDLPDVDIDLVIDGTVVGHNLKVSNLTNMSRAAKYDLFVIADSDMRVDETYLRTIVAPFADPSVGAVTCLYDGRPEGGLASRLAAMFVNEWFFPSVLVSAKINAIRFCFGATMAVGRDRLKMIGGFEALSQYLADDHMLGKLISEQGYRVALSDYVVQNVISEDSLKGMFRHELRWARTVRTVEPAGHALSFVMYGIPLAVIGALLTGLAFGWGLAAGLIAVAAALRVGLHFVVRRKLGLPSDRSFWLIPIRDFISLAVWSASLFGRHVHWRGRPFVVQRDGFIVAKKEAAP